MQARKEVLGQVVNHAPARKGPEASQHCVQQAAQSKERQAAKRGEAKNGLRGRPPGESLENRSQRLRQRVLTENAVSQQLERPGLKGRRCRSHHG